MENVGLPKFIRPRPYWIQYVSTYIVFFLSLFVCKIKVNGKKNIPKGKPLVLASNHFGYFDPFVLVHAIRKPIDFIMQKELGIELGFKQVMTIEPEKGMKKINNSFLEIARQDHAGILKRMN